MIETLAALSGGLLLGSLADRFLADARREPVSFCDHLPWFAAVDDRALATKTGGLLATFELSLPDPLTASREHLELFHRNLIRAFARLGQAKHYTCWITLTRSPLAPLPASPCWPHPLGARIEAQRAASLLARPQFENRAYLSLCLHSGRQLWQRLAQTPAGSDPFRENLSVFREDLATLADTVGAVEPLRLLPVGELIGFLARLLGHHRLAVPADPWPRTLCYLDQYLSQPVRTAPLTVGDQPLAVASILGFPDATDLAFLHDLSELPLSLTLSARLHVLDPLQAAKYLRSLEIRFQRLNFSLGSIFSSKDAPASTERRAQRAAERFTADRIDELREVGARAQAGSPLVAFTLTLTSPVSGEALRPALQVLERHGFTAHLETDNAFWAYLGTLPGSFANVRRSIVPADNALHICPLTSAWVGLAENKTPQADPPVALLQARTPGSTGFHLNLFSTSTHVAHTLILGPTGAGKSVLLQTLALHHTKYRDARVFYCDNGASARLLALALDAPYVPLFDSDDAANTYGLQPLARLETPEQLGQALDWLLLLPPLNGLPHRPEFLSAFRELLLQLAALEPDRRTLGEAAVQCQHPDLKRILSAYAPGTAWGRLFERPEPAAFHDASHPLTVFELRALLAAPEALCAPALAYLFLSLERLLVERPPAGPTLIAIDEAWTAFRGDRFTDFLGNALRTFRKRNAGVVLATQTLNDLRGSQLWHVVADSCPTRIVLPGHHANTTSADLLRDLGLTQAELDLVAAATPREDYYLASPEGSRLFRLGLSPLERAIFTTPQGLSQHDNIAHALTLHRQLGPDWLDRYLATRKEI